MLQAMILAAAVLGALMGAMIPTPAAAEEDAQALLDKMRDFNAVQVIYRNGVPHTDARGRLLTEYDPERSFFQIGIWGNPYGSVLGYEYDLQVLRDAGFNTMWPWFGDLEKHLEAGKEAGLQVVYMGHAKPEDAAKVKDHPNWLGNVWHDEPTGSLWGKDMDGKFQEFVEYRDKLHEAAPDVAVFINDCPWITAPATSWWIKWNTAGDVSCHDNYPVMSRKFRSRSMGDEETKVGIPSSVSLAVGANQEQKPVWFIAGAFTVRGRGAFPFRMPTPTQLRAQVYAALIHGATGIIYFTWDTYVCRDGDVVGMSPDPQAVYFEAGPNRPKPSPARPMQLAESKALWMAATQINSEIRELTPSLLSPTVGEDVGYSVTMKGEGQSDIPVRCILKPHPDGGYVLLTVNLDDAVMDATFEFAGGIESAQPMFENREALKLDEGAKTFTDVYEPFDTHVYRVMPAKTE